MHEHLISYLKDNRDQIVETWLLEAEIPARPLGQPADPNTPAGVPLELLIQTFDRTMEVIQTGNAPEGKTAGIHLDNIVGVTCTCRQHIPGGRVCMELHDSGLVAFLSVLEADWDIAGEFNQLDREHYTDIINHALSGVFSNEIEHCQHQHDRADCPFARDTPRTST